MRIPLAAISLALVACDSAQLAPPPGSLVGTWGGDDAGFIVTDTGAHAHIGCTLGDVSGAIVPGSFGRFTVTGLYNIDAYPVDRGIVHPARFEGTVAGGTMILTVTLTDTAVTLGPVRLTYRRQPGMQNCPICAAPPGHARVMEK